MYVVVVKIVGGRFAGWRGFATGWVVEKDEKGDSIVPHLSLAASLPLFDSGKLSLTEANRFRQAFLDYGGYSAEVLPLDEAEKLIPDMEAGNALVAPRASK